MKKTYAHIGLAGLGSLGRITEQRIEANTSEILAILKEQESSKNYKAGDKLSFDEVDELYNKSITDDEKRAWVWFRINNGVAMKGGWKKYYPPKTGNATVNDVIVTTRPTEILDNAYRLITTVGAGIQLGRPTKFKNTYGDKNMLIFIAPDGAKRWVNSADIKTARIETKGSESYVTTLVKKGALFYTNGLYLPYAIFAFGNMYDRDLQLRADKDYIIQSFGQEVYKQHEELIQKSMPKKISIQNPASSERPFISLISHLARDREAKAGEKIANIFLIDNLREETGLDLQKIRNEQSDRLRYGRSNAQKRAEREKYESTKSEEEDKYTFTLSEAFQIWVRTLPKTDFSEVTADEIITYYIFNKSLSKKEEDKSYTETIERYTPIEGEALFSRFLYEALNFDDQQKLDLIWNRAFNAYSSIPYHKVPVGFECSALFKSSILQFTPAQREAIGFMEIAESGIIAYDVGVGKTMSAIITMANNMQAGRYSRPLLVVPNPTYRKWINEIQGYKDAKTGNYIAGVLTGLGIKINDFFNLGTKVKYKDEEVEKGSISIMTYEGFKKVGFSKNVSADLFNELSDILQQNDSDSKSARDFQKKSQDYREMLSKGNKGSVVDIDTLGIDAIIIDEAHNAKNIFDEVPTDEQGDKRYKIRSAQSEMGIKSFFHCNYIQRTYGGNVMLLTATPFTNSPLEIYSMLSLVGYKSLKQQGIYNLQRFMEQFVLQSLEYINDYDGNIVMKPVVKSYRNRLVLQKLIHNHISYKTGEEAGVKRPIKINFPRQKIVQNGKLVTLPADEQVLTYLKPNILQISNQKAINSYAQAAKKLGDIGKALNKSLDNAISPYLISGNPAMDYYEFVTGSPKIHYAMECIKSIKAWHESRGQSCSGQVIYLNRAKDYFPLIKQYLNSEIGFKEVEYIEQNEDGTQRKKRIDEVQIISSDSTNEQKERIKDLFLAGTVKVIIGTATIREGIDLQTRGSVIYNLSPPWNPTDIRQLEGRIWRQGNNFGYVRVVMPLVQDSMDVFVFQKLEEKTARINDIWFRSDRGNVLDQEALDPEEIKFALFTDINKLVGLRQDQYGKELNRKATIIQSNIDTMGRLTGIIQEYNFNRTESLKHLTEYKNIFQTYSRDVDEWAEKFKDDYYFKQATKNGDKKATKALHERIMSLVDDTLEFLQEISVDDKKIIALLKRGIEIESILKYKDWRVFQKETALSNFRAAVSQLRKAERTILTEKGYDLNSDIKTIIQELKSDFQAVKDQFDALKTKEWQDKMYAEIATIKANTAIIGKSAPERALEFAKTNNLLAYSSNEVSKDDGIPRDRGFMLPAESAKQSNSNSTNNVDEAKVKKLKLLKLKLRLQTQTLELLLKLNKQTA